MVASEAAHGPLTHTCVANALNQAAIVVATDVDGAIVECNDLFCEVSGYSRDELIGADHRIINSGHHPRDFFADMYRTIKSGHKWTGTICNRKKGGEIYWVDTTIVPQRDAAGAICGFLAIRFEITEHMKALEALAEARRQAEAAASAKGRFLANMSHELRTPLTVIGGMAHILAQTQVNDDQSACVAAIIDACDGLQTLVQDVLHLTQLEAGGARVHPTTVDLSQLVRSVAALFQPRADEKGIELRVETGDLPPLVLMDGLGLRQVIGKLVANAIKFTSAGSVCVSAQWTAGRLHCEVRDSGVGFSIDDKPRLFRPFEQGAEELNRSFGGAGLGLSIAADLITAMNGEIDAESAPGQGARFYFSAPAPLAEVRPPSSLSDQPPHEALGLSVLVADDNPAIQLLLRRILEAGHCDVTIAQDGLEAVEAASRETFDLCLLDLRMPRMDGLAALKAIRNLPGGQDLPIYAVSADVIDGQAEVDALGDFDGFLPKPLRPDLILEIVQGLRARTSGVDRTQARRRRHDQVAGRTLSPVNAAA